MPIRINLAHKRANLKKKGYQLLREILNNRIGKINKIGKATNT